MVLVQLLEDTICCWFFIFILLPFVGCVTVEHISVSAIILSLLLLFYIKEYIYICYRQSMMANK